MKFIHLSDIRIGSSAESGTLWEEERRQEIGNGLKRAMDEAVRCGAQLVLISGGLFAHVPTTRELDEAGCLLREYPGIHVVIIAGETDMVKKSSPVMSYIWPSNVHYLLNGQAEKIVLEDLHAEVTGASVTEAEYASPEMICALAKTASEHAQPIQIAVFRAEDDQAVAEAFADANVSYAAVGSKIAGSREIRGNVRCAGFFEPEAMGDSGMHGLLEGEISEETGCLTAIEFVPMASASYVPLVVKINVKTSAKEVEMLVEREVCRRGENNIYRLKLVGSRNPEEFFDLEMLKKKYRISEVIDETEPEYDFRELFAEHPQDMIGFYIAKILNDKHDMSPIEKKAMFYGLDALIKTSDE